jgi:hypothetical protein
VLSNISYRMIHFRYALPQHVCTTIYSSKSGKSAKSGKSGKIRIKKRKKLAELSSCLQMTLLAHHIHFTKEVEACYSNASTNTNNSSRNAASTTTATVIAALETLLDSTLQHISAWSDTCYDSSVDAQQYALLVSTAQIAQALHFRDILSSLTAQLSASSSSSSIPDDVQSNFRWTQHLRYYCNGMSNNGTSSDTNANSTDAYGSNRKVSEVVRSNSTSITPVQAAQPLLPCVSASVGPWSVSYGWNYYGTNERLWIAPLAEKCLYHMIHSARKGGGGLLTTTSSSDNAAGRSKSLDAQTASIQAWDTAVAFGRGIHVLQGSALTSPQAVSALLKRVLMSGDVCVLCSVDNLSTLTRAVLAESLQVISNAIRTGSKKVCMNGTDILLAQTYPHAAADYDSLLHQWKLPGSIHQPLNDALDDTTAAAIQYDNHDFTMPFFTTLATCTLSGIPRVSSDSNSSNSDAALPLNLRLSSRPVSVISPNISVLLPSMLFTNGFRFASQLSVILLQGLSNVFKLDKEGHLAKLLFTLDNSDQTTAQQQQQVLCTIDQVTLHKVLLHKAIRQAAAVVARERGRNFSLADKKLGISTLPKAEKQRNIEQLFLATEARVLVAGVLKAVLDIVQSQTVLGCTRKASSAAVVTEASTTALANTVANVLLQSFTAVMQPLLDLTNIASKRSQLPSQLQAAKQQQVAAAKQSINISDELLQLFSGVGTGTKHLSRDEQAVLVLMKSALVVQGMQPSESQVKAAVAIWNSLWTTRHSAIIICGHTGVGKHLLINIHVI